MFKNMDSGLKRIWMAVGISLAIMVAFTIFVGLAFWVDRQVKHYEAAHESKACETSDVVSQDGTGAIIIEDCHEKIKTRMTPEEKEDADKNYEERMKHPQPVNPADLKQIRFEIKPMASAEEVEAAAQKEVAEYLEAEKTLERSSTQDERKFFILESPRIYICPARPTPYRDGGTTEQQEMLGYMWCVSHGDEKFVTMVEAESRTNPWAVEKLDGGLDGNGYGFCQVDFRYWPEIHQDPRFRTDWKYQARVCLRLWRQDVTFYGAKRNHEMIARFWWKGNPNLKG